MSSDPVLEEVLRRKAALLKQAYKFDRMLWLREQVKTRDEHDFDNPVKPFPIKPYTEPLVKLFEGEQSFNLAKVRQIQATWLFCALAVHTIQFFEYKLALLISKKQEDAFKLIERMRFIYQHQELWLRNLCPLDRQMRDQPQGHLYMRNGSSAMGLPQGPDQVRMHTASLILVDEAAFQDQLEETLAACNPSVMGGGKLVVFSSMLAGHFQRVCEITEPYKPSGNQVVKGFQVKENAEGVKVASLHYSADPEKDPDTEAGAKWLAASSRLYKGGRNSALWRREMEIDPQAGAGELVFPDFTDDEDKILCHPFDVGQTFRLYGGFDWGTRNPVSFHVYAYGVDGILYSIWEYYQQRQILHDVARAIRECPFYDRLEWIASDPSMWTENQATKDGFRSIAGMFMEDLPDELKLTKMMPAHGRSDMRAIQLLAGFWNEEPFKVRISRLCPMQAAELRNLRYPQRQETKNDAEKILDKANHCYSSDTEILTENGFKLFSSLTPGERVAVWGENGTLAYETPKEIIAYDYAGPMREFGNDAISFCVTPNHRMWVANQMSVIRNNAPEYRRVPVDELPQVSWVSKSTVTGNRDIDFPDNLIAWYGFWLAEGCKSENYRGSHYAHVDQSLKKIDRELMRMLWKAGHYSRRYNSGGMVRFTYGVAHWNHIKDQGRAWEKRIPHRLKNASARQLRILIKWMIRGDGTLNDKMFRYNTSSPGMADDFQEICIKAGYVANLSTEDIRESVLPNGRVAMSRHRMHHISIRRGRPGQGGKGTPSVLAQIHKDKIRTVPYSGKVHCVNTESGVVYVRRNGKGMWCGQSWDDLKYVVLSHPEIGMAEKKTKLGTYGYLNECSLAAEKISRETGRPRDEVFREIYQAVPRA